MVRREPHTFRRGVATVGVHHADLNALNILLADEGAVHVLDLDRGRIRARGAWENKVPARPVPSHQ